jgi:transcriptional regulator with XRE-family HTH domain
MKKSKFPEVLKLGENVRKLRAKKGWTQEKLAEVADLNPKYVGFVERGLKAPSVRNIVKLYNALGCSPSKLFEDIRSPFKSKEKSGN